MHDFVDSIGVANAAFGQEIGVGYVGPASTDRSGDAGQGLTLLGSDGAACDGDSCGL